MVSKQFNSQTIEEMPQYQGMKAIEKRMAKLSKEGQAQLNKNIITRIYWYGPVTQKWLEDQVEDMERQESPPLSLVEDHPIEDAFGSEIQSGDIWFEDPAGRVVLEDNTDDYLVEVAGVNFFRTLK